MAYIDTKKLNICVKCVAKICYLTCIVKTFITISLKCDQMIFYSIKFDVTTKTYRNQRTVSLKFYKQNYLLITKNMQGL